MHDPVLLKEAVDFLSIKKNQDYIDATLGGGGYTKEILKRNGPSGKVLAIDLDRRAIERVRSLANNQPEVSQPLAGASGLSLNEDSPEVRKEKPKPHNSYADLRGVLGEHLKKERVVLVNDNFADIEEIAHSNNFSPSGIVFDLGLNTNLLESSGRGFSFQQDEPLLMTYGHQSPRKTAMDVINNYSEEELEKIFKEYGEIRRSSDLAKEVLSYRKKKLIKTTKDLRGVTEEVFKSLTPKILAQIWQAIRIEVNDELSNLEKALEGSWRILRPEGRIVVVSFHSLEDRIVKNFFREVSRKREGLGEVLTKKPIRPSREEVIRNPRSRSARLRCAEKLRIH